MVWWVIVEAGASADSSSRTTCSAAARAVGDVPRGEGEVGHPGAEVRRGHPVDRHTGAEVGLGPDPGGHAEAGHEDVDRGPSGGEPGGHAGVEDEDPRGGQVGRAADRHQVGDTPVDVQAGVPAALGQVHRREHGGDRGRGAEQHVQVAVAVVDRRVAGERRGDDADRRAQVLEVPGRHPVGDQALQCSGGEQVRPLADQVSHPGQGAAGEDVAGTESQPALAQVPDPVEVGLPAHERRVEGAHRGADERVRDDAVLEERLHHADLDGAACGPSGQYEHVPVLLPRS